MKKRVLFTVIIVGIIAVSSVKAQFSIGPGVGYVTKTQTIMLSANVNYDLPRMFGVMADYNYIFPERSSYKWWSLDFDGTYSFADLIDKSKLYGLAGLNLLYYKYPGYNFSYTGVNIGAGWKFGIENKMDLVPEVRVTFGSISYVRVGVKLMFSL
jgi:hypothetical protein